MNELSQNPQSNIGAVMLRNFIKESQFIEKVDDDNELGYRMAHIAGFYEWKQKFNKSKSTYYRWIKELEKIDNNFWYDKHCSMLLFYYAT